ncbi:MAG: phosphotransferase [Clostridiales bacterium]|nr:phosphotransferase [Clostridiales bacterium]
MILIGGGDSADVYQIGHGRVLKLFKDNEYFIREYEACKYMGDMTSFAPQVFNKVCVDNKDGYEMQELIGELFVDVIDDSDELEYYAELMGQSHKMLHSWDSRSLALPHLKERLRIYIIQLSHISDDIKKWGVSIIDGLEDGRSLLHGDYMPYNLMYLDDKLTAMDWSDAMLGPKEADIARTLYFIIDPNDYEDAKYTLNSNKFIEAYLSGYYGNEIPVSVIHRWLIINAIIELDRFLALRVSNKFTQRLDDFIHNNLKEMGSDYLFE